MQQRSAPSHLGLTPTVAADRYLPQMVMGAQICPDAIEGTLFAFFMSTWNLGQAASSTLGAALPIADAAGRVIGTVQVLVESRPPVPA